MGAKTDIAWTEATWNPLRGCDRVSPGCRICYAAGQAARFSGPGQPYEGLAYFDANHRAQWTGKIRLVPEHIEDPIRWQKPRRIFVNSMSDLFHEGAPDDFIADVFAVMAAAQHHTFQILTKRPERMAALLNTDLFQALVIRKARDRGVDPSSWQWPLQNVWLGVSVEDQRRAAQRIPMLLRTPAAVRFLSCEPLLGELYLDPWLSATEADGRQSLQWVIVGGESGHDHVPMDLAWARSIRDQCSRAEAAFFFKQVGGRTSGAGGDLLDGQRLQAYPSLADASGSSRGRV